MDARSIIPAVAVGAALAVGAWPEAAVERYSNREYGIYFDVPAGWAVNAKPTSGLVSLRDTLGLLQIDVAAQIMAKKKDVWEFANKYDAERGRANKAQSVADLLKSAAFPENQRGVLQPFLYDDTKAADDARKKYDEDKARRPVDAGGGKAADDAIPDEPDFLARITTRLYDDEAANRTELAYFVVGGGVGYIITVACTRADFYTALPLAKDAIKAMQLEKLSGGRYALPDAKALAAAKRGIIMGKVLNNGAGVGGAAVNLYAASNDRAKGVPSYSTRSNASGEYTITNLSPGRYYLLEVYGLADGGQRVRSVQPINDIDVSGGRVTFVNVEVVPE